MPITAAAYARYDLHRRARRRILADLGAPDGKLNQKRPPLIKELNIANYSITQLHKIVIYCAGELASAKRSRGTLRQIGQSKRRIP